MAQQLSVNEIIARSLQARGGAEALGTIHSLSFMGTRVGDGRTSKAAKENMRPSYFLVGCTNPECAVAEGYDEKGAWEMSPRRQRVMRVDGEAANALRRAAQFDEPYFNYGAQGYKVQLLGKVRFHDQEAFAIQVEFPWDSKEVHYIDTGTFLDLGNRKAAQVHARGEQVKGITYYSDYRPVNGFLYPFRQQWVREDNGEQIELVQWDKIEANAISDPSFFRPPTVHPSESTALSVRMYGASAHQPAEAVLDMYRKFRKANPSVDTEEDLNWLGYELLKKERFELALGVFQLVTTEHPASANAYDSLGDAYAQMKRRTDAIHAYEKAVEFNPGAEFTRKKLEQLKLSR